MRAYYSRQSNHQYKNKSTTFRKKEKTGTRNGSFDK